MADEKKNVLEILRGDEPDKSETMFCDNVNTKLAFKADWLSK